MFKKYYTDRQFFIRPEFAINLLTFSSFVSFLWFVTFKVFHKIYITRADAYFGGSKTMPMYCRENKNTIQNVLTSPVCKTTDDVRGARWLSGRVSDSGARGPGFETYRCRVVSLSKTLYSPKVLVNYPGSDGSVPTWLKNCWLGR